MAVLSFWVTDREVELSEYPTAADLLVHAFSEFKKLYLDEGVSYAVFLHRAFAAKETHEINYLHFTEAADFLTAEFSRAYHALREHRKKVIEAFTRLSSFDTEAAQLLLQRLESRPVPKPKQKVQCDVGVYERLAEIANRFRVFTPDITGEDVIRLHDGIAGQPLQAPNIAMAVFFLSLLAIRELLPHDWKNTAATKGLLVSTRKGKVATAKYLRNVASQYNIAQIYAAAHQKSKFIRTDVWEQMALAVKNELAGRK